MKRSVINQFDELKNRLNGYVGMMSYRYMNLCIKAEEVSLLTVVVPIEGEMKKIEEVANVAREGDYSFKVFPIYDEDLLAIGQSFAVAHPDFKQERQSMTIELDDGQKVEVNYILVTMPDVDKERYDVLKTAINVIYNETKVHMEEAVAEVKGRIALLSVDEKEEEVRQLKENVEQLEKVYVDKREEVHEDKLKELEEGRERYYAQKSENSRRDQEEQRSKDTSMVTSMRMGSEE